EVVRGAALGEQVVQRLVGGPADRGDGGYAEALEDLGTCRVVDASHDPLDAERLTGHARGDDVGVVAAADRREGEGLRDARVLHHLAVEPDALDPAAREVGAQPLEGGRVLVDHRDVVAALDQAVRQGRPDAAATHDDEVHGADATPEDPSSARTSASGRSGGLAICRPERRAVPRVARMESGSLLKRVFLGRALRTDRLDDTL